MHTNDFTILDSESNKKYAFRQNHDGHENKKNAIKDKNAQS